MNLNALLLCRDPQVLRPLERLLGELGVEVAVSSEAALSMEMCAWRKFDAVIVDMEIRDAGDVLKSLRRIPANKNRVALAVLNGHPSLKTVFDLGASFVVHKPIALERARLTLRAAHSLMCRDRRNLRRNNMQVVASLVPDNGKEVQAIVVDLSDTGMAVLSAELLRRGRLNFHLSLLGTEQSIQGLGEVVWTDPQGRAGLRFVQLPQGSQKQLEYLSARWPGSLGVSGTRNSTTPAMTTH